MPDFESTPRLPADWVASPESTEALGRVAGEGRLVVTLGHEAGDLEGWSILLPTDSDASDPEGVEIPSDEDGNVELVRVAGTERETDPTTKLLVSRTRLDRQTVPASDVADAIRAGIAASAAVTDDGDAEDVEPWAPDDDPENFADLDGSEDDDTEGSEDDPEEDAAESDGDDDSPETEEDDGQGEDVTPDEEPSVSDDPEDPMEDESPEPSDQVEEAAGENDTEPEADTDEAVEAAAAEVAAVDSPAVAPLPEDEPAREPDAIAKPASPEFERDEYGLLPKEAIRAQILAWAQSAYEESCRRAPLSLMLPVGNETN
jgi:hypothetical protein